MPAGKYEVWADDEHQQSYNEKDSAVAHARRLVEEGKHKRVQVWDLTHTKATPRGSHRILDPKLLDYRKRAGHFVRGHYVEHGTD